MSRPRWMKLVRDLVLARGRMAMLIVAIAASTFSVALMLSTYTVMTREMVANYLCTHPASAFIELDRIDDALIAEVRKQPNIADAEATTWVNARLEVAPNQWMPLLLFVVPDFANARISTVSHEAGAFPPSANSILLEREVLPMLETGIGDSLIVQTPNGTKQSITISGTVHDPSLAPAWQEQTAYGYITLQTLASLGEEPMLHILKVTVRDQPGNITAIETTVEDLVTWLKSNQRVVEEIRIPPPLQHPHQSQMNTVMMVLLTFSVMALVLSAVLTATMIGGLLAQQIRQIGMMKAVGARSSQIAAMYLMLVIGLGLTAAIIGTPLGILAGRGFSAVVAQLLNLRIYSSEVPIWVYIALLLMGILLPLAVAISPIRRATSVTVREILADYGASTTGFGAGRLENWLSKIQGVSNVLVLALRNTFRRRSRLLLSLSLLGAAGGMFMTGINTSSGWETYTRLAAEDRRYDLEVRFNSPQSKAGIAGLLSQVEGVEKVESWDLIPAAIARANGLDIIRTYPDGGHGSFTVRAAPLSSKFMNTPMISGRWLRQDDGHGVVLNQGVLGLLPDGVVGSDIELSIEGRLVTFRVVGIIRQILSPSTAYVTPQAFADLAGQPIGLTNTLRIAMNSSDPEIVASVTQEVERVLAAENINISVAVSEARLDDAISGHVFVFIVALILIAAIMALVGMLGLTSNMSTSVIERTREFGIMRSIGARSQTVLLSVISEGFFIGLMSYAIALALSLPLSLGLGSYLGNMSFRSPIPLQVSPVGLLLWMVVLLLGSIAASAFPARQAAKLTVRETLTHV